MSSATNIPAYVAAAGKPAAVTVADDIHIFHFQADGNWREADLLFVNRNGHAFRVIRQPAGRYQFVKTWNGMFNSEPWMTEANLTRLDPLELIQLCGVGPQNKKGPLFETLCLLPREAATGRGRKAAWRGHLVELGFNRDLDTFTVHHPYDASLVPTFTGKPWESKPAAEWCATALASSDGHLIREYAGATSYGAVDAKRAPDPVSDAEINKVLETSGMWGMFG